jgi:hypothetical protein
MNHVASNSSFRRLPADISNPSPARTNESLHASLNTILWCEKRDWPEVLTEGEQERVEDVG